MSTITSPSTTPTSGAIIRRRKTLLYSLVFTTTLTPIMLAHSHGAAAADERGPVQVEEIIVTAQRRAEKLENVPMSVTAITSELAEKSGAQSILDIGQIAPGTLIAFNGTSMQPSIRGVTTTANGPGFENNVAIYLDGIYQGETTAINMDLGNIADIQVLKGPQGALYGRNATGGAILINTLAPSKTWTGKVSGSYARFNEKTVSGYLSGPINDRLRFSASSYIRTNDGYFKMSDPATGLVSNRNAAPYKTADVRIKLEADVTDDLKVTTGYNYSLVNDLRNFLFTQSAYISPALPPPPARPLVPDPYVKAYNSSIKNMEITNEATLKIEWKTGIGTLTSLGAITRRKLKEYFDTDGTYSDLAFIRAKLYFSTYQESLVYDITAIKNLDLLVGADYYHDFRQTNPNYTSVNGALAQISYNQQRNESYAFYADATYHFTDRISLNAGGRFAHDSSYINFFAQTPTGVVLAPSLPKNIAFKKFIPRASVRYELAPQTNVYFSFSRGYKAGGWPYGSTPLLPVRPETISAYEVGFKTAGSTIRFDTAAFYYDFKDLQISVAVLNPLCNPATSICSTVPLLLNGPKSEIYGLDGQFTVTPTEHMTLRLGGAYVHARYKSFPNAVGTGLNTATNLNVLNQTQDQTGQQLARAPTFSGSVGIDYQIPTSFGDFLVTNNVSYTTKYVPGNISLYGPLAGATLANQQRFTTGPYALWNAQITWTDTTGHLSLSIFGRNLTDKRYWQFYQGNANGSYPIAASPRVVGARAGYQF